MLLSRKHVTGYHSWFVQVWDTFNCHFFLWTDSVKVGHRNKCLPPWLHIVANSQNWAIRIAQETEKWLCPLVYDGKWCNFTQNLQLQTAVTTLHFTIHTHILIEGNLAFSISLKDTLKGIDPTTFQLVDNPLYHPSHSCSNMMCKLTW